MSTSGCQSIEKCQTSKQNQKSILSKKKRFSTHWNEQKNNSVKCKKAKQISEIQKTTAQSDNDRTEHRDVFRVIREHRDGNMIERQKNVLSEIKPSSNYDAQKKSSVRAPSLHRTECKTCNETIHRSIKFHDQLTSDSDNSSIMHNEKRLLEQTKELTPMHMQNEHRMGFKKQEKQCEKLNHQLLNAEAENANIKKRACHHPQSEDDASISVVITQNKFSTHVRLELKRNNCGETFEIGGNDHEYQASLPVHQETKHIVETGLDDNIIIDDAYEQEQKNQQIQSAVSHHSQDSSVSLINTKDTLLRSLKDDRGLFPLQKILACAYRIDIPFCKPASSLARNHLDRPLCLHGLCHAGIWSEKNKIITDILGPDIEANKRAPRNFVGLRNLGATCYMNVLFQTLFMNRNFRSGLYSFHSAASDEYSSASSSDEIVYLLQELFGFLEYSSQRSFSPDRIVSALGLKAFEQQDVNEFNSLLMSYLETRLGTSDIPEARTLLNSEFRGKLSHIVECQTCHRKSERKYPFFDITLQIKDHQSIYDSLLHLLSREYLSGSNQYLCDYCCSKQDAARYTRIDELPQTLNIQLMRFDFCSKTMQKIKLQDNIFIPDSIDMSHFIDGVGFEQSYIDRYDAYVKSTFKYFNEISPESQYCDHQEHSAFVLSSSQLAESYLQSHGYSNECESNTIASIFPFLRCHSGVDGNSKEYKLAAVLHHKGTSANHGHYTADIRDENKNWLAFDDENVCVLSNRPYADSSPMTSDLNETRSSSSASEQLLSVDKSLQIDPLCCDTDGVNLSNWCNMQRDQKNLKRKKSVRGVQSRRKRAAKGKYVLKPNTGNRESTASTITIDSDISSQDAVDNLMRQKDSSAEYLWGKGFRSRNAYMLVYRRADVINQQHTINLPAEWILKKVQSNNDKFAERLKQRKLHVEALCDSIRLRKEFMNKFIHSNPHAFVCKPLLKTDFETEVSEAEFEDASISLPDLFFVPQDWLIRFAAGLLEPSQFSLSTQNGTETIEKPETTLQNNELSIPMNKSIYLYPGSLVDALNELRCRHNKLNAIPRSFKAIKKQAWDLLILEYLRIYKQVFGSAIEKCNDQLLSSLSSAAISGSDLCAVCGPQTLCHLLEQECAQQQVHSIPERIKAYMESHLPPPPDAVWMTKTYLTKWKSAFCVGQKASSKHDELLDSLRATDPIKGLVCNEHSRLYPSIPEHRRIFVSKEIWQVMLKQANYSDEKINCLMHCVGEKNCDQCIAVADRNQQKYDDYKQQNLKKDKGAIKKLLTQDGSFPSSKKPLYFRCKRQASFEYYLLPFAWVRSFQRYHISKGTESKPGPIDFDMLRCHCGRGLRYGPWPRDQPSSLRNPEYGAPPGFYATAERKDIDVLVNSNYITNIEDAPVLRVTYSPGDVASVFWEFSKLCFEPPVCESCLVLSLEAERLENLKFSDKEITVTRIPANDALCSMKATEKYFAHNTDGKRRRQRISSSSCETYKVEVSSTDNINDVKLKLLQSLQDELNPTDMALYYDNNELMDAGKTLEQYRIPCGADLKLKVHPGTGASALSEIGYEVESGFVGSRLVGVNVCSQSGSAGKPWVVT